MALELALDFSHMADRFRGYKLGRATRLSYGRTVNWFKIAGSIDYQVRMGGLEDYNQNSVDSNPIIALSFKQASSILLTTYYQPK